MKSVERISKTGHRHSLLLWLVAGLGFFAAKNVFATEYYVATTGSDSNAGTQAAPFATLQKGGRHGGGWRHRLDPRRDVQDHDARVERRWHRALEERNVGYQPNQVLGLCGRDPAFRLLQPADTNGAYTFGIVIGGSWVHLKGIEECCVPMNTKANNGFANNGSNNILELLNAHNNQGAGFQVGSGSGTKPSL